MIIMTMANKSFAMNFILVAPYSLQLPLPVMRKDWRMSIPAKPGKLISLVLYRSSAVQGTPQMHQRPSVTE
jgi:hypothetical protein